MNKFHCVVLICLSFIFESLAGSRLPSDFILCANGDSKCIPHAATDFVKKIKNGRKDLQVPVLDPFRVNSLEVTQGAGSVKLDLKMFNIDITGLSTVDFLQTVGFETDPRHSKFELYGNIPKLVLKGNYKIGGKIYVLPVDGNGDILLTLDKVRLEIKFKPMVSIRSNGETYIRLDKLKVRATPDKFHIHLTNLFNGDKLLAETTNKFLNENWKIIWDELFGPINNAIAGIVHNIIDYILDKYSYADFFLPR